jgi:hypothetical protein
MSTITLTKTLTAPCDGQCGGIITVVTDCVREAHAETDAMGGGTNYVSGGGPGVVRYRDGSLVAACGAYDPTAERTCDGAATFTRVALAAEAFATSNAAAYMTEMETADA